MNADQRPIVPPLKTKRRPNDRPIARSRQEEIEPVKARDFGEKFDARADVSGDVDWTKARRLNLGSSKLSTGRRGAP
jgi:hypothetical protein